MVHPTQPRPTTLQPRTFAGTLLPWLQTRVGIPPKMLDYDEQMLLSLLDRVRELTEGLSALMPSAATEVRVLGGC